jgi:hypothetical protein
MAMASEASEAMTTISAPRASIWKMMRMGMPPESIGRGMWGAAAPKT